MELVKFCELMGICENGKILFIDNAVMKAEGLNTNFMAKFSDVGALKCQIVDNFLKRIGSKLPSSAIPEHIIYGDTESEKKESLLHDVDLIFSGLDNENANLQLITKAKKLGKPILVATSPDLDVHSHSLFPGFDDNIEDLERVLKSRIKEGKLGLDSRQLKFPFLREHTVTWALETFRLHFNKLYDELHDLKENQDKFKQRIQDLHMGSRWNIFTSYKLELIKRLFIDDSVNNFADCVDIAIDCFLELFNISIDDLITKHPKNSKKESGKDFWDGMKRFPDVLELRDETEYTITFLVTTAKLYALVFKISIPNEQIIKDIVKTKMDAHVAVLNASTVEFYGAEQFSRQLSVFMNEVLKTKKYSQRKFKNIKLNSKEHSGIILNFIHSTAALRNINFKLPPIKKYKVEHMAFKVTPTIDTVNSMISSNGAIAMIRYFTGSENFMFKPMNMSPSLGTFHFDYRDPNKLEEENVEVGSPVKAGSREAPRSHDGSEFGMGQSEQTDSMRNLNANIMDNKSAFSGGNLREIENLGVDRADSTPPPKDLMDFGSPYGDELGVIEKSCSQGVSDKKL